VRPLRAIDPMSSFIQFVPLYFRICDVRGEEMAVSERVARDRVWVDSQKLVEVVEKRSEEVYQLSAEVVL